MRSFSTKTSSSEKGSIILENTIVLPLFLGLLFIFQDIVVVGYSWLAMQHSVNQGVRVGILGPTMGNPNSHINSAISKTEDEANKLGVLQHSLFRIKNSTLYDNVDVNNPSATNVLMEVVGCGLPVYDEVIQQTNWGQPSWLGEQVVVSARKTIKLTPATGLLMSLVGGDGHLTLRASARGYVEPQGTLTATTNFCNEVSCPNNGVCGFGQG